MDAQTYLHSENPNARGGFPYLALEVHDAQAQPQVPGFRVVHWHEDLQFVYVSEGEVRIKTLDAGEALRAGEGIFINKNTVHLVDGRGDCRYNSFLFPERFLWYYEASPAEELTTRMVEEGPPYLALHAGVAWQERALELLRELAALERGNKTELYCCEVLARLNALWLILLKKAPHLGAPARNPATERTRLLLDYIEAHYAEDVSLADMASSAHISTSEALRCFKRALQTTPYRYLVDYRLFKAAELLSSTDLPVGAVAQAAGFHQQSYFGKCFKGRTGLAPREYRQLHGNSR